MEQHFAKTIQSLDQVFEFLNGFMAAHKIGPDIAFSVNLAVEEFFTNMVKYDSANSSIVTIGVERQDDRLVVDLTDYDVDPFDVTKAGDVDTGAPLERRKIGGLGIHIAKKLVDSLSYSYSGRTSKITLVKHLEKSNV